MTTKPIGLALLGLVVAVSSLLAVGLTSAATVTPYGPEGLTPAGPGERALTFDSYSKIPPEVMAQLSGTDEATFWAILHRQADLSAAPDIGDWDERGAYVVDQLRSVADESQAGLIALLERRGVSYRPFWIVNAIQVTSDSAVLQELAARREVARIDPERVYHIPEPLPGTSPAGILSVEWGVSKINAPQVWTTYGNIGQGIVVANIDTGVHYTHPVLVNQYRGNLGGGNFDHN